MFLIRDLIAKTMMYVFGIIPINKKKIVFKSDRGMQFSDSPLALFNKMKELYPDNEYVWVSKNASSRINGAKVVKEGSLKELYELSTAAIWVDNKRKGNWTRKRKNQIYIQTWHGAMALKKVEKDVENNLPEYYVKSAKHDSNITDFFLSGSDWTTAFYKNSFWYNGTVLEYGVPRSDVFYQDHTDIIRKVRNHYRLMNDEQIVLYAPTFRDNDSLSKYNIDYDLLLNTLKAKYGGNWKVLLRFHPNILKYQQGFNYTADILNGNDFDDINELIISCELLITDYSSCMFDAMECNKKVIVYASDIDEYVYERGFYFSFDELPFPLATNNSALNNIVKEFNSNKYDELVNAFKKRIGLFNNCNSSEKVSNYVIEKIAGR